MILLGEQVKHQTAMENHKQISFAKQMIKVAILAKKGREWINLNQ